MSTSIRPFVTAVALLTLAGTASAHTGHGAHGFLVGLEHPFGADHLLAMVAVGAWSACAWRGSRRALGPLTFIGLMSVGAVLGAAGVASSLVDAGIAASIVLMGVMLAAARTLPAAMGLTLIAVSALLHGLAHGAEAPAAASNVPYAAGFLLTTCALHALGLALGARMGPARVWCWRACGALLGGAGLALLSQV